MNYQEAMQFAEDYISKFPQIGPDAPDYLHGRLHNPRLKEAFEEILKNDPEDEYGLSLKIIYQDIDPKAVDEEGIFHEDSMARYYQRIFDKNPNSLPGLLTRAGLSFIEKGLEDAQDDYQRVLEIDPDNPMAINMVNEYNNLHQPNSP